MKTISVKKYVVISLLFLTATSFAKNTSIVLNPPVNDLIENAIDLSLGPINFIDSNVNFPEATTTGDGGQQGCGSGTPGVWYKFTATAAGVIGAGINPYVVPAVVFYTAPNLNATSGQELTWVDQPTNPCDNGNFSSITTTPGTSYYIFVKNNVVADVMINLDQVFAVPANDFIENAIGLNDLEDYFQPNIHFLMATYENDNGQNGGCDTQTSPGIWYKFTAEVDGQVIGGISSGAGSSAIIFYTADNENATTGADLTWVDQPTNLCQANNLTSIMATGGTTYYVFVGTNFPFADFSINLSGILGTQDQSLEGFQFYPNPVTNEINLSAVAQIDEVTIFNLLGRKIYAENSNSTHRSIDLSFLETGLYIMNVTSNGASASFKIVKE